MLDLRPSSVLELQASDSEWKKFLSELESVNRTELSAFRRSLTLDQIDSAVAVLNRLAAKIADEPALLFFQHHEFTGAIMVTCNVLTRAFAILDRDGNSFALRAQDGRSGLFIDRYEAQLGDPAEFGSDLYDVFVWGKWLNLLSE